MGILNMTNKNNTSVIIAENWSGQIGGILSAEEVAKLAERMVNADNQTIGLDETDVASLLDGGVCLDGVSVGTTPAHIGEATTEAFDKITKAHPDMTLHRLLMQIEICTTPAVMMNDMNSLAETLASLDQAVDVAWGVAINPSLQGQVNVNLLATLKK